MQMTNGFKLATNSGVPAAICVWVIGCFAAGSAVAQPDAVENELKRFKGQWRVVEMVEDGRAIPEDQMRLLLPGGGVMEIVDYTILFKSPADGAKSTKTFRIDPTAYPKKIVVAERDTTTGTGIYKFDNERLVLCISNVAAQIPSQFSAPAGSKRNLIIMERFEAGTSKNTALNLPPPPRKPLPQTEPVQRQVPAQTASARTPPPAAASATPAADQVAAQVLTDTQVRNMAIGSWRINDSEGSIDIVFDPSGVFRTYRYAEAISNFHVIFVPTPISSGNWSISGGRLIATVTSSTRIDRVNQSFVPRVRSISATDMILVDHLGRVSRAVKLQ